MNPRAWWRGLREQNRRDTDERTRTIGLLVVRDAFIAVMLLIGALVLLPALGGSRLEAVTEGVMVLFPLPIIFVAGAVIFVSAALRGGFGLSSGGALYQAIWSVIGGFIGVGIIVVLALFGIVFSLDEQLVWTLTGVISGFLIGTVVLVLMHLRKG